MLRCIEDGSLEHPFPQRIVINRTYLNDMLAAIPADKREIVPLCRTNRYIIVALYV